MALCNRWGISHSAFLRWPDDDQDKALAFADLERRTCSMCGTLEDEWVDEQGRYLDPPQLEPIPVVCHGCEARDLLTSALEPQAGQERVPGQRVVIVPFDPERDIDMDNQVRPYVDGYDAPRQDLDRLPSY